MFGSPDGRTLVVGALYFIEAGGSGFFAGLFDEENKLLKLNNITHDFLLLGVQVDVCVCTGLPGVNEIILKWYTVLAVLSYS